MKKIIFLLIIFNFLTFNSKAQIAYIDINLILNTSKVGKSLNLFIKKIENEDLTKYKLIENDLLKKEKELISQQNILKKEQFQSKLTKLSTEVQKYRSDKKMSLEKLKKIRIDKTKEILKTLNPIITKYVDSNAISIVLPKKNIIVGKKNLDITEQIITLLDNKNFKLNF
mgnify:FL=1